MIYIFVSFENLEREPLRETPNYAAIKSTPNTKFKSLKATLSNPPTLKYKDKESRQVNQAASIARSSS
jgi:hypothetical protein